MRAQQTVWKRPDEASQRELCGENDTVATGHSTGHCGPPMSIRGPSTPDSNRDSQRRRASSAQDRDRLRDDIPGAIDGQTRAYRQPSQLVSTQNANGLPDGAASPLAPSRRSSYNRLIWP